MKKVFIFLYACCIIEAATAQWSLTGNAGTNPAANFLGTTDNKDFVVRTNNLERMRITLDGRVHFSNQGNLNLFLGLNAGKFNTTGTGNSALGHQALFANTTGVSNTGLGSQALFTNKTGSHNTAGGYFSMYVNTSGANNTAYGSLSLNLNSTGSSNVAVGYYSLYSNKAANYNTAVGSHAGRLNTSGAENTYIGTSAGRNNDTGKINTCVGINAGYYNKVSKNTFIGGYAGFNNTTGYQNVFNGYTAGYSNTSGWENSFDGYEAGYKNTTGYRNVAHGYRAMYANINGHENIAIGPYALMSNTSGVGNTATGTSALFFNTTGSGNTASGQAALTNLRTGSENTAVGNEAGFSNSSAAYNVTVGSYSGNLTTGGYNTYVGTSAGRDLTTGFYNTCVGINSGFSGFSNTANSTTLIGGYAKSGSGVSNATGLGYGANPLFSNSVRIGNASVSSIGGYAGWSNFSDGRYKKEMREDVPGLVFINELKPLTYHLDITRLSDFLGEDKSIEDGKTRAAGSGEDLKAINEKSRKEKEQIVYSGFVAQDVEAAAKKLNYDFSGVDKPGNENGLYGLRYAEFVVPLVKAVQELSKMNDNKEAAIADLKSEIKNLKSEMEELKSIVLSGTHSNGLSPTSLVPSDRISLTDAALDQNIPNPFNHTTSIPYRLPQKFSSALIIITDKNGKILKQVNISGTGNGLINIDAAILSSGAYQYSLVVDGKLIGSKQMERLKR